MYCTISLEIDGFGVTGPKNDDLLDPGRSGELTVRAQVPAQSVVMEHV